MAKAMSAIEKLKSVEAAIRDIALVSRKALEKIDASLSGKRSPQEVAALQAAREDCLRIQNAAREAVGNFYDRVEGRPVSGSNPENAG
jgi:hypothetical protein